MSNILCAQVDKMKNIPQSRASLDISGVLNEDSVSVEHDCKRLGNPVGGRCGSGPKCGSKGSLTCCEAG